jgi:hypothetical protein
MHRVAPWTAAVVSGCDRGLRRRGEAGDRAAEPAGERLVRDDQGRTSVPRARSASARADRSDRWRGRRPDLEDGELRHDESGGAVERDEIAFCDPACAAGASPLARRIRLCRSASFDRSPRRRRSRGEGQRPHELMEARASRRRPTKSDFGRGRVMDGASRRSGFGVLGGMGRSPRPTREVHLRRAPGTGAALADRGPLFRSDISIAPKHSGGREDTSRPTRDPRPVCAALGVAHRLRAEPATSCPPSPSETRGLIASPGRDADLQQTEDRHS